MAVSSPYTGVPVNDMYMAAQHALDMYFVLQPVGSDTQSSLRDRIAWTFAQQYAPDWMGGLTPQAVDYGNKLTEVAFSISPMSRRKSNAEISVVNATGGVLTNWWMVAGAVAVVGVVAALLLRKKKRRK